ncbi:transketolase [Marispirochaeta aestuarii]|uniref:Transketolase n=1 Tax=Marispirochaeta aestuarii TaxID=1963862 RepID=A0A1Y1RZ75_9SPIO|nr:transketolase C-terminal domain-containing protein [Marispirochaeta aestuarii]ORC35968.1 transketolase [Marispirochaeta aestuarii]
MDMRTVFMDELLKTAEKDKRIVFLDADLGKAGATASFADSYPDRKINAGVAESNMIGIAAGLASVGKIPFAHTFGCFASRRVFDQFFISAAYAKLGVKLVGTDPGVAAAFNGGTHMPFEDLGLMRIIPGLPVIEPSDPVSCIGLLRSVIDYPGPVYFRLYRKELPVLYKEDETFEIGKAKIVKNGGEGGVLLLALGGIMLNEALLAANELEERGVHVSVIDVLSLKPLDEDLLLKEIKESKIVLTCENHQKKNGLGSAVAELIAENGLSVPLVRIGVDDLFGQVGTEEWLKMNYGLSHESIIQAVLHRSAM